MLIIIVWIALIAVTIAWGITRRLRAPAAVRSALEKAGYRVLKMQHRRLRTGPYSGELHEVISSFVCLFLMPTVLSVAYGHAGDANG